MSIATALALCLTLLPTAVLAAEEDEECVHSYESSSYHCDETHHYPMCDICEAVDESSKEAHADLDNDHFCDVCGEYLRKLCTDADGDHTCDNESCSTVLIWLCEDENPVDHLCDNEKCGCKLTDCEDTTGDDNICDICGKGMYPWADALNVEVTPGNGEITVTWTALENVGNDQVASYTVYCALEDDSENRLEVVYPTDETVPFTHTFEDLTAGETYEVGVCAVYTEEGEYGIFEAEQSTSAAFYDLWVGGVQVTSENVWDVLDDDTVSFDPATHTLTLNNAHINVTDGNYGIRSKTFLDLELMGENSITCSGVYGFHSTDDVTVIGDGSLNVTANDVGIYIAGGYEVGGLYLKEDVTLTVTSGNVTSGNSYGVRVDDVLEVRDNATLTATAGTAPDRSCAIYAYDEFNVYDNAVVTATGADQSIDLNTDCDGIRTTHITMEGGTVTATGGTAATTNGIYTRTFDMYGGTLTAVSGSTSGGTCFGPSVALQSNRSFNMSDGIIYATSGSAGNDQSCGILVSNGEMQVNGGHVFAQSGEANFSYGIKASQLSLSDGYTSAEGSEGVWCSSGISVEGSLSVTGGTIYAAAHNAETYSYGIQAFEMAISGGDISASAGSAANSYGLWSFGSMDISAEEILLNPYMSGFIGTKIAASAEDGYAVYSRTAIQLADTMTFTAPEGGSIAAIGEDDLSRYYTAVASDGTAAQGAEIGLLTYTIFIEDVMGGMSVKVPVGWSANKAYCEHYEVEDFSKVVNDYAEKDGYTFVGCYTDEACTAGNEYDFHTPVTEDITIYPKWVKQSSGSSGSSNTTAKTEKNEDGSTTTITTNKITGTVTETTKNPDGTTGTVVTDQNGNVTEVSAKVPADAAKDAEKSGEAVKLPITVEAAKDTEDAQEIKIDVPSGGAKVEIPVEDVTPGTVVVLVNEDGTEEIIKTSTVTEDGVVVTLDQDATVKVIDNSKTFADVHSMGHWAEKAIDFVVARGIYSGTSATTFHPDNAMTRGMLAVVLHNLENNPAHDICDDTFQDVAADSWYEDAIHWAADSGIVSGYGNGCYGPNDSITREQLAVMLWRSAGSPDSDHSLEHFKDAHLIASYAETALAWANENGIINGKGDGILDPKGNATRAQVAQMLMNYLQK